MRCLTAPLHDLRSLGASECAGPGSDRDVSLPGDSLRTLDELERLAIEDALKKSQSVTDAARRLGIGKTTLYWKLRRYELQSEEPALQ